MPSATPDADVPVLVNVGQNTVPDLRIPAAARANAAADTADLPIITTAQDDPGEQRRRRRQLGSDRRTRAMEMVPKPVSDRRVAMGRLAIIVTVAAWLVSLATWFFNDFFAAGHESALDRAEEVLYLLIVTMLTVSALAYLLSRLGFFYRTRTHHRSSRAILDQFYDTATPSLTTIIPSYQEDTRVICNTVLSAALQEYPDKRIVLLIDDPFVPKNRQARDPLEAGRRVPRRIERAVGGAGRRVTRGAPPLAAHPVLPRAARVRACRGEQHAARPGGLGHAGRVLRRGGQLAGGPGRRPGDRRPHPRLPGQAIHLRAGP